ncbi:MAG: DUF3333 domain-containing protein, partial [Sphingomonas sp.]
MNSAASSDRAAFWASAEVQGRVRRRYAAERRFRAGGLIAVLLSVAFLAFLLFTMAAAGLSGFRETRIALPIDIGQSVQGMTPERLAEPDAAQVLRQNDLAGAISVAADAAYGSGGAAMFGSAAEDALITAIIADPALLNGRQTVALPAAADIDTAYKGDGSAEAERTVASLASAGALSSG